MALRKAAAELAPRLGLRFASPLSSSQPCLATGVRAALSRAYATVLGSAKYADSHEYALADGDTVTVGISDHAQEALGDVVYVELPEVGAQVNKGTGFGVVESVKAASDIYAPVSGEVVAVNSELTGDPSLVNTTPYEGGWLIKVKMSDPSDLDSLRTAEEYTAMTEE